MIEIRFSNGRDYGKRVTKATNQGVNQNKVSKHLGTNVYITR